MNNIQAADAIHDIYVKMTHTSPDADDTIEEYEEFILNLMSFTRGFLTLPLDNPETRSRLRALRAQANHLLDASKAR